MAESDPSDTQDETVNLLSGLETGDLRSGIYEGGFKTWECAVDLGGFVAREGETEGDGELRVVELGAGSAVPSLVLLDGVLRRRLRVGKGTGKVKFTLCDYNEDVLRLGTAVNVLLVVALTSGLLDVDQDMGDGDGNEDEEGDLEVDEQLVQRVLDTLEEVNIEIDLLSGAWGSEFVQLLKGGREQQQERGGERYGRSLLLASETIYSPDSLRVFSETVLDILRSTEGEKKAYVAAKKVYFGVGGGVQEFEGEIRGLGGRTGTVLDVKGSGVGRVVLEVFEGRRVLSRFGSIRIDGVWHETKSR